MTCPCNGKRRWTWHVSRGVPQCESSRAAKKERGDRWVAGTSILVPEVEAL